MLGKLKVLRIIVTCIVLHAAWQCTFGKQVRACCHIVFVNTRFSEIHFQLACTTIQFSTIPITFNFPSRDLRKLLNLCIQMYDARSAVEESYQRQHNLSNSVRFALAKEKVLRIVLKCIVLLLIETALSKNDFKFLFDKIFHHPMHNRILF